jgi:hypothetical protein
MNKKIILKKEKQETHPWRLCPEETFYRKASHIAPYTKSNGTVVSGHSRSATCALNPSGKDQLYPDEIHEISKIYFDNKLKMPCLIATSGKPLEKFDLFIAGWTHYWNDIFKPKEKLDPNFVKALIDSESSFREKIKIKTKSGKIIAWGLLQLKNDTRKILGDENGELKDHYLTLTKEDLLEWEFINLCWH